MFQRTLVGGFLVPKNIHSHSLRQKNMNNKDDILIGKTAVAFGYINPIQLATCIQQLQKIRQQNTNCSLSQIFIREQYERGSLAELPVYIGDYPRDNSTAYGAIIGNVQILYIGQ